ncbi:hypothetical protein [uncultured Kordia sp.]|uniref:hypothetical protein n=1 Tax=uncultured Kordia sp. TaxID=507699 RepID=UPI0026100513|nr:hypothetical protein [uncultured Kordia sp.]
MENLLQLTVPLIIGVAIGYFICKKFGGGNTEPPNVNPSPNPPNGIITVAQAVSLHENYKNERYPVINEIMVNSTNDSDFIDTQFVWFSYEKMREYMKFLENIQAKNPNNKAISGIRVYFGAYKTHDLYSNQQTVFFTPTIEVDISEKDGNMKNLPFYIAPDDPQKPYAGKYKIIKRLLVDEYYPEKRYNAAISNLNYEVNEKLVQKSSNPENDDDGTSVSFNEGNASPPPRKKDN